VFKIWHPRPVIAFTDYRVIGMGNGQSALICNGVFVLLGLKMGPSTLILSTIIEEK
jgi:hypothetical protein